MSDETSRDLIARDDFAELFERLNGNDFRRKFHLNAPDVEYVRAKGLPEIERHAHKFVEQRLSAAIPKRDGKQTPYRGHPVFVAQHATGTCCRSCLLKWHGIAKKIALSAEEQRYIVNVLIAWIARAVALH